MGRRTDEEQMGFQNENKTFLQELRSMTPDEFVSGVFTNPPANVETAMVVFTNSSGDNMLANGCILVAMAFFAYWLYTQQKKKATGVKTDEELSYELAKSQIENEKLRIENDELEKHNNDLKKRDGFWKEKANFWLDSFEKEMFKNDKLEKQIQKLKQKNQAEEYATEWV